MLLNKVASHAAKLVVKSELDTKCLQRWDSDRDNKQRFLAVSLGVDEKVSLQIDF